MQNSVIKNLILLVFLYFFTPAIFSQGWFALNTGSNRNFAQVFFTDQNTGYITGDTTVKTTNGGLTWSYLNIKYTWSVYFINSLTGFMSSRGNNNWGISKTTDGGLSWTYNSTGSYHAWNICFVNNLTGWAGTGVQFSGEIYKTTNGGDNWISIYNYDCQMATQFFNTNIGYTHSYYGQFRKTTDGGLNWVLKTNPTGGPFESMRLTDTNTIYMCSIAGTVIKSTDGANSWITYQTGNTTPLYSIFFVNSYTGYSVGGSTSGAQKIVKTTNGGVNWYLQQGVPPYMLLGVYFINADTGWAVGDSGRVIKTTNGGVMVGIENEQNKTPSEFKLNQNYPNPFNPSTTISYQLAKQSYVTLKVFDLNGKEVAMLVNNVEQPGYKSVEFNANDLSSGVYYYRLQAGNFTDTKKLVLLK